MCAAAGLIPLPKAAKFLCDVKLTPTTNSSSASTLSAETTFTFRQRTGALPPARWAPGQGIWSLSTVPAELLMQTPGQPPVALVPFAATDLRFTELLATS